MTNKIPDFTEFKLPVVIAALKASYREEIELKLAGAKMQIKQIKQINNNSNEKGTLPCHFPAPSWC